MVGEVRLTLEQLTTMVTQIEACLNSRPVTPLPEPTDAKEVLTPGHFLIGHPLEALPNPHHSYLPYVCYSDNIFFKPLYNSYGNNG